MPTGDPPIKLVKTVENRYAIGSGGFQTFL
jgi:hypothetical protein